MATHWRATACRAAAASTPIEDRIMTFDYLLGGIVTVGLLIYLTYTLLRPEKF